MSYVKAIEVQITRFRSNSGVPDVEGNVIIPIRDMQWDNFPKHIHGQNKFQFLNISKPSPLADSGFPRRERQLHRER